MGASLAEQLFVQLLHDLQGEDVVEIVEDREPVPTSCEAAMHAASWLQLAAPHSCPRLAMSEHRSSLIFYGLARRLRCDGTEEFSLSRRVLVKLRARVRDAPALGTLVPQKKMRI